MPRCLEEGEGEENASATAADQAPPAFSGVDGRRKGWLVGQANDSLVEPVHLALDEVDGDEALQADDLVDLLLLLALAGEDGILVADRVAPRRERTSNTAPTSARV